jgi:L-threonylcarbamoyladenylate synthase
MSFEAADAEAAERSIAAGGIVVFPADTVYGLACDPESRAATARLYELKGRPATKPAAVMFFSLAPALDVLREVGPRTQAAAMALLPGAVTLLLTNPRHRFAPACGPDPDTLGLRVPALPAALAALARIGVPVLATSANLAGEPDPRSLDAVPAAIRDGADLVLDGGALPGTPSTVLDLRDYERDDRWSILRVGAVDPEEIEHALRSIPR